ncbi:TRAP transporter substrate-binding protein [Pueribacillus theae]|nr:TRAP transporter substrate-binding protein DctP [Pueribacillus theae]
MLFKNKLFLIFNLSLLVLLISACSGSTGGKQEEGQEQSTGTSKVIELDFNNVFPATHHLAANVFEPMEEVVKEKTDGQLKINFHHSAVLGSVTSTLDDLNGGLYDMALGVPGYFYDTDLFKLSLLELPFSFENVRDIANVQTKFMELHGEGVWGDKITYSKVGAASDPFVIYSTKEIRSVDDMKGMKVAVTNDTWNLVFEEWGVTPVQLDLADLYEGLQRGVIDAALWSTVGGMGIKLYEPAPYIVDLKMYLPISGPVIRTEALEKMPEDLRNLFVEDILPEFSEMLVDNYEKQEANAWKELEKLVEGKGEIIKLSPEAEKEFKQSAEETWNNWVDQANERGFDGEQLMNDYKQIRKELGIELPF